ncbi:MAG: DNA topoisomerase 3 [Burkholderiaceae bacterium]|jgi:DNA topoisomerase-3|nr:DNA topoisomerase 3 [Burkholderiaceae bacterium]
MLIIAEKPSMARSIAGVLGQPVQCEGFITCARATVTWCAGHLLEQLQPEEYFGGAFIGREDLPVVPDVWKLQAKDGRAQHQINVIQSLLKDAREVVNAGDADREGQLLVDEVLIHLGWKGKTLRLWTGSLDDESLRRALASLKPNEAMHSLYESALARQRADWLLGYNASIAFSRNLKAQGLEGGWSIGRVQTPTLALIVDRMAQIKGHTRQDHYTIKIILKDGTAAVWQIPDELLTDGLMLDQRYAEQLAQEVDGKTGAVQSFVKRQGTRAAPLPYSLAALQMEANSRIGLSAKETLEAAQALYEAKATTYPRTDCRHLPEEMHPDAARILQAIGAASAGDVNPERQHAAWNDREITAHHAIIPTGQALPGNLNDKTQKVYDLIKESYIRLFMADEQFEQQQAIFEFHGSDQLIFKATAKKILQPGWTALGQEVKDDESQKADDESGKVLPGYTEGQPIQCEKAMVEARQTKPPKPYNDKTLIAAMIGIHKLVTDPKLKARLKETSGLGTEATRAAMIETLIERGYTERKNKEIHPTERGIRLIILLRQSCPTLTDPGETAIQEDALADIAAKKLPFGKFMENAIEKTRSATQALSNQVDANVPTAPCPACGKDDCIQLKSKAGNLYWKCRACQAAFGDHHGQPGRLFEKRQENTENKNNPAPEPCPACPRCKQKTGKYLTRNDKPYFRCAQCNQSYWPDFKDKAKIGKAWETTK